MTTKMKGLLKGLRYISQIFDNEKEPEIVIGNPTDVKHVAHIGWEGPSVASPSWMTEFKSSPRHSAPLDAINKDIFKDDPSNLNASEGSSRGRTRARSNQSPPTRELPDIPKSTRRNSSNGTSHDSPTKAKSERMKPSRKSSKGGKGAPDGTKHHPEDGTGEADSPTRRQLDDAAKKSKKKKPKDSGGGSTRSSSRSKTKASSSPPREGTDQHHSEGGSRRSRKEDIEEEEEEKQLQGLATPDRHI
ncbi:hypothetical protein MLD38_030077 [Melastoma candidum]|uniref:Uncharacterized protein n=1 Tax=Melastoma candidum TaxID=119954 RepID=A0ACB9MKR3_9MYRT|nr:hypothetical protein MLD38_030077 [Melastoma candidum]